MERTIYSKSMEGHELGTNSPENSEGEPEGSRDWKPSRIPLKRSQGMFRAKSRDRTPVGSLGSHSLATHTYSAQLEGHLRNSELNDVSLGGCRPISTSEDDISYMLSTVDINKADLCKTTSLGSLQPDMPPTEGAFTSPTKNPDKNGAGAQSTNSKAGRSMSAMSKSVSAMAASATNWGREKARKGSAKGLSEFKRKASQGLINREKQTLNLLRSEASIGSKCSISDDCHWRPPRPTDFTNAYRLPESPTRGGPSTIV